MPNWIVLFFLALHPVGAQLPKPVLDPGFSQDRLPEGSVEWTFPKAQEAFGDDARSGRPARDVLRGKWDLLKEVRDPGARDSLPILKSQLRLDGLVSKLSFSPPHDGAKDASVTLTLETDALGEKKAKKPVQLLIKCSPDAASYRCGTGLGYRKSVEATGEIITMLDLKWSVSIRALGPDALLCLMGWEYKLFHQDLPEPGKAEPPAIRLDEKPSYYAVYSRRK